MTTRRIVLLDPNLGRVANEANDEALWVLFKSGSLRAYDSWNSRPAAELSLDLPPRVTMLAGDGRLWLNVGDERLILIDPVAAQVVRELALPRHLAIPGSVLAQIDWEPEESEEWETPILWLEGGRSTVWGGNTEIDGITRIDPVANRVVHFGPSQEAITGAVVAAPPGELR